MIVIQDIHKSFGDKLVLNGISAQFEAGKTSLIIGTSGSGKTVLMKSMIGLFEIDQGAVLYDGVNFSEMNFYERKNIRTKVGMLFQGSALFDSLTVEENIRFPLDMFTDMTNKEKKDRVDFCLDRVNMKGINKLFPSEISGGMQKRVGIARAIVQNPQYLFCDEPNSGLDPQTSILIDTLIKEITTEYNITTIINTHDMNSVMEIGDYILYLHQGHKHWEGSNVDIIKSDNRELNDFIFASSFLKEIKKAAQKKS